MTSEDVYANDVQQFLAWYGRTRYVITRHAVKRYCERVLKQRCPKPIPRKLPGQVLAHCLRDSNVRGKFVTIKKQPVLVTVIGRPVFVCGSERGKAYKRPIDYKRERKALKQVKSIEAE